MTSIVLRRPIDDIFVALELEKDKEFASGCGVAVISG
jgi:hypothetical protein